MVQLAQKIFPASIVLFKDSLRFCEFQHAVAADLNLITAAVTAVVVMKCRKRLGDYHDDRNLVQDYLGPFEGIICKIRLRHERKQGKNCLKPVTSPRFNLGTCRIQE